MDLSRYPIATYYLEQINWLLENKSYLPLLLTTGTFAELIARELTNDEVHSGNYAELLKRLYSSSILSEEQFRNFDRIRRIRNLYVHLHFDRLLSEFEGWAIVEDYRTTTFLNEVVKASAHPEKEALRYLARANCY